MTFGNFDESFLRVPILKEDRVIGVLQVKRRKGNNKVYFNYDDNQNDINFFQTYIFDKRGKKPRENIIKLTGGENAKLATVTCVTASF